jgi:hypothetical protein
MNRSIEVEIDEAGVIQPLRPDERLPAGRALLTWPASENAIGLLLSEKALAEDWLRPEEDEAWAHLQLVK